jgi:large subunit ribosomal protein L19
MKIQRSDGAMECWSGGQQPAAPILHHATTPLLHQTFMNQALLDKIESEQYRKQPANFGVGDSVRVHTKVVEGDKERVQIFAGVVIGKRGRGLNETFTVRRISYGEGVERVFPVHSPRIGRVEVERKGAVRRAKLTYLRKRIGKGATLVKEKETRAASARPATKQSVGSM